MAGRNGLIGKKAGRVAAQRIAEHAGRAFIVIVRIAENAAGDERDGRAVEVGKQGRIAEGGGGILGLGHAAGIGAPEVRRRILIDGETVRMGGQEGGTGKKGGDES